MMRKFGDTRPDALDAAADIHGFTACVPVKMEIVYCDSKPIDREQMDFASLFKQTEIPLYVAAPMVRYSRLAFRAVVRQYGCQLCFTPMMYANCFVKSDKARKADFSTDAGDHPLIAQFAADNADDFVEAANLVSRHCEGVNLNCGCPKKKTLDANCGSALLRKPDRLAQILHDARRRIHDPQLSISAKIRILYDLRSTVDLCQKLERAGLSFLVVHGRRPDENHEPVDASVFKLIKDSVCIPVVANGDAKSLHDVHEYARKTGVDGVMVARGLLSNPALFGGYQGTPVCCVQRWVDAVALYEVPFTLFHRHLSFMTEKLLNKMNRLRLNAATSFTEVTALLDETLCLNTQTIVSKMNRLMMSGE